MKLKTFYQQLFFSERTAAVSTICILVLSSFTMIFGSNTDQLKLFDYFDHTMQLILSLFLFYGYRKHNLLSMQAGTCCLLVSVVYYQASYVMTDLFGLGSDYFMALGFWGSFFLACQLMVLILEFFFLLNHLETFILKRHDYLRIAVNQTSICVLLGFLFFLLFVIFRLMTTFSLIAYFMAYELKLIATYMLVGCSELILAIDSEE